MVLNYDPGNVKRTTCATATNKPPVRTVTLSLPPGCWPKSCRRWLRSPTDPREQLSHEMEGLGVWELPLCGYLYTSCGIPQVSYACMHALLLPLYPTLWDPMDCSPPGFSARGILQARILGWVAISPPAGIFPTQGSSPHLLRCMWILYHWDTKGAPS